MSTPPAALPAYKLRYELDHLEKIQQDKDAYIVEWPEFRNYSTKFMGPDDFEYPSHGVEFQGYESVLSDTDYPYNDVRWPIMSRRMLYTLNSVRAFPHRIWEVPFVGFSDDTPAALLEGGLSGGVRYDNKFVAVQLLMEDLDIFDWENSVYERYDDGMAHHEGGVRLIRKLALHVPPEGLPPIFRLKVSPVELFISPEARAALEAADIKGIEFR
jgi:hypothetical protein